MKIPSGTSIELPEVEWCMANNIFIKQMLMEHENTIVPQHSHTFDHVSLLAAGSVRAWKDGIFWQDFKAPLPLFIQAGIKHTFMSLEPNTLIYCVHNSAGEIDIRERA